MGSQVSLDIPRLYTALAEWMACVSLAISAGCAAKKQRFALQSALYLVLHGLFMYATGKVPVVLWIPCMIMAFAGMLLFLHAVWPRDLKHAAYYALRAFLAAEFAASLEWQLQTVLLGNTGHPAAACLFMLTVYTATFALIAFGSGVLAQVSGLPERLRFPDRSWREVFSAAMIVVAAFVLANISFVLPSTPFSAEDLKSIHILRTMTDAVGLAILHAYESRIGELSAEREAERMNAILASQYESYRSYQDTIDLIHFKYHDLKHQLAALRSTADGGERERCLDELEDQLDEYRPQKDTGNQVLNTLLEGKSGIMRRNGIELTCVADGQLLSRLHVTDICSIFGNALDNAIESAALAEDPQMRYVHLLVTSKKHFLVIDVRNYCRERVEIRDGLPVRDRGKDARFHGYGTRSIQCAVQKYGGTLTFSCEDHEFEMRVLIPLAAKADGD